MLYRAHVDTSPVTEGVTLFKHQLLLLLKVTSEEQTSCFASATQWLTSLHQKCWPFPTQVCFAGKQPFSFP